MASVDWQTVALAATIATGLSTVTSVLTSVWWRRVDRRESDWVALESSSQWVVESKRGNVSPPMATFTIGNVGDGAAYRLKVLGVGCLAQLTASGNQHDYRPPIKLRSSVPSGDSIEGWAICDP